LIEWLYQTKKRYSGLSVQNYMKIQNPRKRKGIIDFGRLMYLLGFENYDDLKEAHYKWVDSEIQTNKSDKGSFSDSGLFYNGDKFSVRKAI
jgi:hypothetical protein